MAKKITTKYFLEASENIPIIDVRSPAEYEKAHIPGAFNIPLFSNEERAIVGTAYKQQGKEQAMFIGLGIVGPKMRLLAEQAKNISVNNQLLVHCWRGGMRSESMAWLFKQVGIECTLLRGGYKAYRSYFKNQLSQLKNIIVLSGYTGSGKTDILNELELMGEQVIDLEGLAHHKGSAFGAIGMSEQPSTEQFENNLFEAVRKMSPNKRVWVEDESKAIGKNFIPDEFFKPMRSAPVVLIDIPKSVRIKRLVEEYTNVPGELLIYHLNRIAKRLGPLQTKLAIEAVKNNEMSKAVDLSLTFYDKAYEFGLTKRTRFSLIKIKLNEDHPKNYALQIIDAVKNNDFIDQNLNEQMDFG
ncbi:MAG: tRNA 2-selenouridine(34) synthase MnmH [Bacteroidales bacterium]|nr:tRNA 2-selenouridine(34) synthase MnmH [Bacteroidales bacterium]